MISVCIPTYEQRGYGRGFLRVLLDSIARQRGAEFEVIVSDNSRDKKIETLCAAYALRIPLRYSRNRETFGVSNNTNRAIELASSDRIKIMYQDDLILDDRALQLFEQALERKVWAVASYFGMTKEGRLRKRHDPFYPENMLCGKNTIGMPSVLAVRRNEFVFDPKLRTRLDCEYYFLLHARYGEPEFIRRPLIGCRYWDGSVSRIQGDCTQTEYQYLLEKHGAALTPA